MAFRFNTIEQVEAHMRVLRHRLSLNDEYVLKLGMMEDGSPPMLLPKKHVVNIWHQEAVDMLEEKMKNMVSNGVTALLRQKKT